MSRSAADVPLALDPVHTTGAPNAVVPLFDGRGHLAQEGHGEVDWRGALSLVWLPSIRVIFRGDCEPSPLELGVARLTLEGEPTELTVSINRSNKGRNRELVAGVLDERVVRGAGPATRMVFHLANFPVVVGDSIRYGDGLLRRGRLRLEGGGWVITIDAVRQIDELVAALRETGGSAITYVGEAARHDGGAFEVTDAEELIVRLAHLLSFARGAWTWPLLPVAFDEDDQRVWELWQPWRGDVWSARNSWFSPHHPQALNDLFAPLLRLWTDPAWADALTIAFYWYVGANTTAAVETALILALVGLELLGWLVLVEQEKLISREGFDRLRGPDRLRLLLSHSGVGLELPSALGELASVAAAEGWEDGPRAVVELRNDLVHPSVRSRRRSLAAPIAARIEAAQLARWYLELMLLHLLEYRGEYSNRITAGWIGEVEQVPWTSGDRPTGDVERVP